MPRQPRYFLPDIPQHLVIRGVDRQETFFAAADYDLFLDTLAEGASEHHCQVHAYVLMTNHVHLLLTPQEARSIPKLMQALGRGYVQTINRRYDRTGTLWQGRYKACLVQTDNYLLTCQRYIELNPVRAGMVADPADYAHSSYTHNALGGDNALLTPHECYLALGRSPEGRRQAYRQLFESALARPTVDHIRESTNACRVLGNDAFTDRIEQTLGRRVRPRKMGRPRKATPA